MVCEHVDVVISLMPSVTTDTPSVKEKDYQAGKKELFYKLDGIAISIEELKPLGIFLPTCLIITVICVNSNKSIPKTTFDWAAFIEMVNEASFTF